MAHFPFRSDRSFPVQVKNRTRHTQEIVRGRRECDESNIVTDEIKHHGRAEQADFSQR